MKIKTSLLFLFLSTVALATPKYDNQAPYADFVATDQIILQFQAGMTTNQQEQSIRGIAELYPKLLFLDGLDIAVAKTKVNNIPAYFSLIEDLEQIPSINYVGLYMHNGKGHKFGILNKIFVKLKKSSDQEKLSLAIGHNDFAIENYPYSNNIVQFEINKTATRHPLALAMDLIQTGDYEFAEPNYLLNPVVHGFQENLAETEEQTSTSASDPLFYKQWALQNEGTEDQWSGTPGADMAVTEAWDLTMGDPNILIAIMDSGIDTLHPDLYGQLQPGFDATGQGRNGYPDPRFPSDGHGTACAGIVGATANNPHGIAGVAPNCQLVSSRIFFYADTTYMGFEVGIIPYSTSQILADGTNWAWQVAEADVQSHSWSLPDLFLAVGFPEGNPALVDDALQAAFTQGRDGKGSLLFFSSGNEGDPPNWPGRDAHSMAVNASSYCDEAKTPTSCDSLDWTGNFGTNLDFAAPGVRITTLDMLDTMGYSNGDYVERFGGTSAACPNAAGVGALILSANPGLSATSSREILSRNCDKVGGYDYTNINTYGAWSEEMGYGRINAYKAVLAAQNFTNITEVKASRFKLWPNPADSHVYFETVLEEIEVFDAIGQLVYSTKNATRIHVGNWQNGVYQVRLKKGGVWQVKKIVVFH